MPAEVSVGIIANPASGRDIRRLVAGASVFGNADKGGMVYRLLAGLGATGVGRALMMPAADGVSSTLRRRVRARATENDSGGAGGLEAGGLVAAGAALAAGWRGSCRCREERGAVLHPGGPASRQEARVGR